MEEEVLKIVQNELNQLLREVDLICEKENIRYSLAYGSMLGAVRHQGFIPWDDDLDIFMDRENYEKFQSVFPKYETDVLGFNDASGSDRVPRIVCKKGYENEKYKITNLQCDIFIMDPICDNLKQRKKLFFQLKMLQGMMKKGKIDYSKYNFKGKILVMATKFLGKFRSLKSIIKQYAKVSAKFAKDDTACMFCSNDEYASFQKIYDKKWFAETVRLNFDGTSVAVYKGFDPILSTQFGDYMTPVKMEKNSHIKVVRKINI